MEIKSPAPEPKTITVTDIDITMVGGVTLQLTLFPGDGVTEGPTSVMVKYIDNQQLGRKAEETQIYMSHIMWISKRKRVVTLPPEAENGSRS